MRSFLHRFAAIVLTITMLGALTTTAMAEQPTFMGKPILDGTWMGESTQFVAGEICINFRESLGIKYWYAARFILNVRCKIDKIC